MTRKALIRKTLLSSLMMTLIAGSALAASADYHRQAQGDITQPGARAASAPIRPRC